MPVPLLSSVPCYPLFPVILCSLFPVPCSLFPVPCSLFPIPYFCKKSILYQMEIVTTELI
ncbi:MAG: hypothetical protein F6J98_01320 [Moorea sp. SIO4G2]|uniref:hypothetical protein n=1 Tax=unclassified Moorena TaxID=2683338 RepID=UPI0013FA10D5|nr:MULTISPECIES: hypothetical protein [unclassified Moorena]NEO10999.1 hypothetical protein [Moorena sp. SIO3E8]NEO59100.1 hypothetical protein [Moorena sp. SIO4G2]NEP99113.1 hypothetical protein [Moorena sp. SIO3F7]